MNPELTKDSQLTAVFGGATEVAGLAADRVHARRHNSDPEEAPLHPGLWLVVCGVPLQGSAVVEPLDGGLRRAAGSAGVVGRLAHEHPMGRGVELCDAEVPIWTGRKQRGIPSTRLKAKPGLFPLAGLISARVAFREPDLRFKIQDVYCHIHNGNIVCTGQWNSYFAIFPFTKKYKSNLYKEQK